MSVLCCQITRGMAPAISVASVVTQCMKRGLCYELISGKPAAVAKNTAAQMAVERDMDLLLVEDDIIAKDSIWDAACDQSEARPPIVIGTCLMKNGMLNTWFAEDRVLYSGTVFLRVRLSALHAIGAPWFECHDLTFVDNKWTDLGKRDHGMHSDAWFYYRAWMANLPVTVAGFVLHILHEYNTNRCELVTPNQLRVMGLPDCNKVSV